MHEISSIKVAPTFLSLYMFNIYTNHMRYTAIIGCEIESEIELIPQHQLQKVIPYSYHLKGQLE